MSAPSDDTRTTSILAAMLAALPRPVPDGADAARQTATGLTERPRDWPDEVPAKITAWDTTTQSATWVERSFDANGNRVDKTPGLFGSPTSCPAKPVGNGLMPPPLFPVDVTLRRRLMTADNGVVYEFPWVCACAGSGSGSGSGTGVLTACCPGAISSTLTATFTQTGGTACALDGAAVTVTGSGDSWTGTTTAAGVTWTVTLACSGGALTVTLDGDSAGCGPTTVGGDPIDSCAPAHFTFAGVTVPGGCAGCPGATFTITFTE